jgi:transposase InsO family protein
METESAGSIYRIEDICKVHGLSRQAYYQWKRREIEQNYEEEIVLQLIHEKRKRQPRLGGRKLHQRLKSRFKKLGFKKLGFKIGRDRLFKILSKKGLLVEHKRRYAKTTNSSHMFRIYENLIKELVIYKPNQVLVADITYIDTREGFIYLAILTDVYSRKILGYDVSDSLSVEGSIRALKMALKVVKTTEGMIHHSDRGIQYCCNEYTKALKDGGIRISMAEKGNPYENAIAERVNGILKIEFLLSQKFRTKTDAVLAVKESIKIYNEERPHMSLNYMTPSEMYEGKKAA